MPLLFALLLATPLLGPVFTPSGVDPSGNARFLDAGSLDVGGCMSLTNGGIGFCNGASETGSPGGSLTLLPASDAGAFNVSFAGQLDGGTISIYIGDGGNNPGREVGSVIMAVNSNPDPGFQTGDFTIYPVNGDGRVSIAGTNSEFGGLGILGAAMLDTEIGVNFVYSSTAWTLNGLGGAILSGNHLPQATFPQGVGGGVNVSPITPPTIVYCNYLDVTGTTTYSYEVGCETGAVVQTVTLPSAPCTMNNSPPPGSLGPSERNVIEVEWPLGVCTDLLLYRSVADGGTDGGPYELVTATNSGGPHTSPSAGTGDINVGPSSIVYLYDIGGPPDGGHPPATDDTGGVSVAAGQPICLDQEIFWDGGHGLCSYEDAGSWAVNGPLLTPELLLPNGASITPYSSGFQFNGNIAYFPSPEAVDSDYFQGLYFQNVIGVDIITFLYSPAPVAVFDAPIAFLNDAGLSPGTYAGQVAIGDGLGGVSQQVGPLIASALPLAGSWAQYPGGVDPDAGALNLATWNAWASGDNGQNLYLTANGYQGDGGQVTIAARAGVKLQDQAGDSLVIDGGIGELYGTGLAELADSTGDVISATGDEAIVNGHTSARLQNLSSDMLICVSGFCYTAPGVPFSIEGQGTQLTNYCASHCTMSSSTTCTMICPNCTFNSDCVGSPNGAAANNSLNSISCDAGLVTVQAALSNSLRWSGQCTN